MKNQNKIVVERETYEKDGKSYIMVASSWESKYTLYSAIVRMLCLIE